MAYIGKQPVVGNFVKLDAIVTSATTTFNLLNGGVAYSPQSANNCIVSLNGIIQEPTSSGNVGGYTISGSTIVFTSALTTLDVIDFILVLGDTLSIGTPSDGTVSFAKVTSNLITGATAETSIAGGDSVLIYDDSASALRKMTRTNFVAGIGGTNTPAFQAKKTTTQTLAQNTYTTILFDSEDFDTASAYDTATGKFTPQTAGKYFVEAQVAFDSSGGNEQINIMKNSSVIKWSQDGGTGSTLPNKTQKVCAFVDLNGSTDFVLIQALTSKAGGATIQNSLLGTGDGANFSAFKIIE